MIEKLIVNARSIYSNHLDLFGSPFLFGSQVVAEKPKFFYIFFAVFFLENRLLVLLTQGFEMHFESVKSDVGYPLFQYFITVF